MEKKLKILKTPCVEREIREKKLNAKQRGLALGICSLLCALPGFSSAQTSSNSVLEDKSQTKAKILKKPIWHAAARTKEISRDDRYQILRYNEDWSFLSDPKERTNIFDGLKFIPLNTDKSAYLTFFGDLRFRNVNETSHSDAKSRPLNFLAIRTDLGADLHVTPYFRAFFEAVSAQDLGANIGIPKSPVQVPPAFKNPFDVLQGFVEPSIYVGNAKIGLRVGREVMKWGNGTVIDPNDFPNVQTAFDAIHPYLDYKDLTIDAFISHAVTMELKPLSDFDDANTELSGVYVSQKYHNFDLLGHAANGAIEPFFFLYRNTDATYAVSTQTGLDTRYDYGLRLDTNVGGWDFDNQAIKQNGTFATRTVNAWAIFTNNGYTFRNLPLTPRLGLQFDAMSGGDVKGRSTIFTYQPLFPSALYFADMAFFAPSNLIEVRPTLTFHPTQRISIEGFYGFFWRQNVDDAIYATAPFKAFGTSSTVNKGRLIGEVPQILFSWDITPQISFNEYASILLPAPALVQSGGGKGDVFSATTLAFRF